MSILIGLSLLIIGASFGYILCAILSFDRNYIDKFEFATTSDEKRRPNYLLTYGDDKMIEMYYNKELSWVQIKVLKWLFGVDVKKLDYEIEEEARNDDNL